MSKKLTIDEIAEISGVNKKTVAQVLDALSKAVETGLAAKQDMTLPGIGKLAMVPTAPRNARNPRTGESVPVPAGHKVKFTVAGTLKAAVAA